MNAGQTVEHQGCRPRWEPCPAFQRAQSRKGGRWEANHSTGQRTLRRGRVRSGGAQCWGQGVDDKEAQPMPGYRITKRSGRLRACWVSLGGHVFFPKTSTDSLYPGMQTTLSQEPVLGHRDARHLLFFSEFVAVFHLVMLQQKYRCTCAGLFVTTSFHETNAWTIPNAH